MDHTQFLIPVITVTLMWTNDWHYLLRESIALKPVNNDVTYLSTECGPWYYMENIYGYSIIVISLYVLINFSTRSSSKQQTLTLIASATLPIISNVLDFFKINPLRPYGPTSIIFSFTGLVLAWGLFRQHLLDITPIARNVVLENIGDGIIVLDTQKRIVDVNPAAYALFNEDINSSTQLIGRDIDNVISPWRECDEPFDISSAARTQLALTINGERRFYNVTISPLADNRQEAAGRVSIFTDITNEKQTNERLQNQLDEIRRLQDQLREQAIRDPLNGCFNRHSLNEMLLRESSRASREQNTIGLMILDIDHIQNTLIRAGKKPSSL